MQFSFQKMYNKSFVTRQKQEKKKNQDEVEDEIFCFKDTFQTHQFNAL